MIGHWKRLTQALRTEMTKPREILAPSELLIWGERMTIQYNLDILKLDFDSRVLDLRIVTQTPQSQMRALTRFLTTHFEEFALLQLQALAQEMDVAYTGIRFGNQKTRWGSRSSSGSLQFNYALIHTPKDVARYVIVHELAHFHHMDHSWRFWELVGKHDPHYRTHRTWLKHHQEEIVAARKLLGVGQ
jgi:hypothetical protein